jgi:hypothetical protein
MAAIVDWRTPRGTRNTQAPPAPMCPRWASCLREQSVSGNDARVRRLRPSGRRAIREPRVSGSEQERRKHQMTRCPQATMPQPNERRCAAACGPMAPVRDVVAVPGHTKHRDPSRARRASARNAQRCCIQRDVDRRRPSRLGCTAPPRPGRHRVAVFSPPPHRWCPLQQRKPTGHLTHSDINSRSCSGLEGPTRGRTASPMGSPPSRRARTSSCWAATVTPVSS